MEILYVVFVMVDTEVEKLMDKDCDTILGYIAIHAVAKNLDVFSDGGIQLKYNKMEVQNLKTAWRQNDCKI